MPGFIKTFAAVAVALIPGGFVLLLAYVATRIVRHRHDVALASSNGAQVSYRAVLSGMTVRDVLREAKASF